VEQVVRKLASSAAVEKADLEYYRSLTPQRRLEILQELIDRTHADDPGARGFVPVCRIVKLGQS
jgi:hypothetical protein